MKAIFISSVLLLLSFCVNAQNNDSIIIGKKETIYATGIKCYFKKVIIDGKLNENYSPLRGERISN